MHYKKLISFSNLLETDQLMQNFVGKLEQLAKIQEALSSTLSPDLVGKCTVANLRQGNLILSTSSPAWNHKLRFSSLDILSSLREIPSFAGLKSIEIRVDLLPQVDNDTTTSSKKPKPMSNNSASVLAHAAQTVSCPRLSASLRKLSKQSMLPSEDVDTQ